MVVRGRSVAATAGGVPASGVAIHFYWDSDRKLIRVENRTGGSIWGLWGGTVAAPAAANNWDFKLLDGESIEGTVRNKELSLYFNDDGGVGSYVYGTDFVVRGWSEGARL